MLEPRTDEEITEQPARFVCHPKRKINVKQQIKDDKRFKNVFYRRCPANRVGGLVENSRWSPVREDLAWTLSGSRVSSSASQTPMPRLEGACRPGCWQLGQTAREGLRLEVTATPMLEALPVERARSRVLVQVRPESPKGLGGRSASLGHSHLFL